MSPGGQSRPVAFGSLEWFRRVGETSVAIGKSRFHQELIGLFGCLIRHDACWIIRFSDPAPPEIMYTRNVSAPLRDHYNDACSAVDPFAAHWRLHKEVGVQTLSRFKGLLGTIDATSYSSVFKPAANVSDELGLFLPTIGNSSVGLFLEREQGEFKRGEIECAKAAFPILSSLEKAHIGQAFDSLRYGDPFLRSAEFSPKPILVQDRYGVEIFSSASWRKAVEQELDLLPATKVAVKEAPIMLNNFVLEIRRVDKYFPFAPGGRILTLRSCPSVSKNRSLTGKRMDLVRRLTPREREIFDLIIAGRSTSDISRILTISKGAIKNSVIRIYKKSQVHTKRELMRIFLDKSYTSA